MNGRFVKALLIWSTGAAAIAAGALLVYRELERRRDMQMERTSFDLPFGDGTADIVDDIPWEPFPESEPRS